MQAAVVGAGHGELQGADNGFFAAYGQVAELFNHQPADGVHFFVAVVRAEEFVHIFDFGNGVDAPAVGGNGEDIVRAVVFVEFVFDVAQNLLDYILQRYQAADAAVFVHHHGQVVVHIAKLFKQHVQRLALGHEHGWAQHVFELELFGIEGVFEQVFGVQDAEHVIFVVGNHGEAGMGGAHHIGDDAADAVAGLHHVHLGAADHGVAHFQPAEINDFFQPLLGIFIEDFLFARLAQQGEYVFGGIGAVAGKAAEQPFKKSGLSRVVVHFSLHPVRRGWGILTDSSGGFQALPWLRLHRAQCGRTPSGGARRAG